MSADTKALDRELGETSSRMDDHHRRLAELEALSKSDHEAIAKMDARLRHLEDTTKSIQSDVKLLLAQGNELKGFANGVKMASSVWYAALTLVGGIVGAFIMKAVDLLK